MLRSHPELDVCVVGHAGLGEIGGVTSWVRGLVAAMPELRIGVVAVGDRPTELPAARVYHALTPAVATAIAPLARRAHRPVVLTCHAMNESWLPEGWRGPAPLDASGPGGDPGKGPGRHPEKDPPRRHDPEKQPEKSDPERDKQRQIERDEREKRRIEREKSDPDHEKQRQIERDEREKRRIERERATPAPEKADPEKADEPAKAEPVKAEPEKADPGTGDKADRERRWDRSRTRPEPAQPAEPAPAEATPIEATPDEAEPEVYTSEPTMRRRGTGSAYIAPDVIVAVSHAVAESHIAAGADADRMVVIANGVAAHDGLRAVEDPLVGYVGRLAPIKGIERLMRAVQAVRSEIPETRLVLVGPDDGPAGYADTLRRIAARPSLRGAVTFTGPARPALWYPRMACMALASESEGMPLAVLEAMASGVPCVVPDVGGCAEAVGDAGLLVRPRDVDALAGALVRLLGDAAEAARLGALARERAAAWTVEDAAAAYSDIYLAIA